MEDITLLSITFLFLIVLLSSIKSAKTFEANPDNTSDHLPIQMTLNFTVNDNSASYDRDPQCSKKSPKFFGPNFHL